MRPHRRQGKHHVHHSSQTGGQPGTSWSPKSAMRASVKHPQTFQRPQHPQAPGPAANHNSESSHLQDHPESGRLYKPASSSIQQDSNTISHRDNFSGSDLSSSTLQHFHQDYFSGSPSGLTNKAVLLTDPYRQARIAGGLRSGPAQTHPRAALPDIHLEIGAGLPEAAATSRTERPPVVLDIPGLEQLESTCCSDPPRRRGSRSNRSPHKRPRNHHSGQGSYLLTSVDGANDCATLLGKKSRDKLNSPLPL